MPLPRPATEARNGSLEPGQPSPISQYAPPSRPVAHSARLPDVYTTDVWRQTDVRRQTALSLNVPCRWAGHDKYWLHPFRVSIIASFSLHEGFGSLLRRFGILTVSDSSKDLGFDDELFHLASLLDPTYVFHWLSDHLGSQQEKVLRQDIIGNVIDKKLSCRWQTAWRICANAMAWLTSLKHASLHMC